MTGLTPSRFAAVFLAAIEKREAAGEPVREATPLLRGTLQNLADREPVARGAAEQTPSREGAWTCACRYMNSGPICTHCGKLKPGTETATVAGPASPGDLP